MGIMASGSAAVRGTAPMSCGGGNSQGQIARPALPLATRGVVALRLNESPETPFP